MTDQPESETGSPAQDDESRLAQSETSNQQAGTNEHPADGTLPVNSRMNPEWKVCPYNLAGTCRHGDKCWYSHAYQNNESNTDSLITGHSTALCPRHQIVLPGTDPPTSSQQSTTSIDLSKWAEAPEFVPQEMMALAEDLKSDKDGPLCPFFLLDGRCTFSSSACPCVHGDTCEWCELACLDPNDEAQRKAHRERCSKKMEKHMEKSFSTQRSEDKVCGICHDVVWDKELQSERKFGILESCNHVFCLGCIRTWRQRRRPADDPDPTQATVCMATRQCPECRAHSNFFVPSSNWVEGEEEKLQLIQEFKNAVAKKPCRYFKVDSTCPLGESCFYLHPESIRRQQIDRTPPPPPRRRRHQGEEEDVMEAILLWDYLDVRDEEYL